jgi:hypothetical protein
MGSANKASAFQKAPALLEETSGFSFVANSEKAETNT